MEDDYSIYPHNNERERENRVDDDDEKRAGNCFYIIERGNDVLMMISMIKLK